jgi:thiol peroxidase
MASRRANMERTGVATMKGTPITLIGPEIKVGDKAPDFNCIDMNMNPVTLANTKREIRLIASVPSLDTHVCNKMTIRFNDEAERENDERVAWITVSMDLPFAQKRFVEDEDIQGVKLYSDHRNASFGEAYGVLIKENRLLSRAVFVIDRNDTVRYVEYVRENGELPNFEAALRAVWDLVAELDRAAA